MENIISNHESSMKDLSNFASIAGLFGIMGSVLSVTSIFTAMLVYPFSKFNWAVNSISSLGAVGPTYDPPNVVVFPQVLDYGLMISAVFLFIFALGLIFCRNNSAKNISSTTGSVLFLIASVGVFGVGYFALPDAIPHGISAGIAFILITVALNIFGWKTTILSKLSKLLGAISIVGIVWFAIVHVSSMKFGLAAPEMVIIFPAVVWAIPVSIIMIKNKLGT